MRLNRSSLHTAAVAALVLSCGVACGGGAAAPTPTPAPTTVPAAVPAPSPQRPPLASPIPSPSSAALAATPTAASTDVASETYEVQSGDTLLTIAQQYYGDGAQWRRIYDANKDTIGADPDKLKIGMKLTIPPKQS